MATPDYGSLAGTKAYIKHMTLDAQNNPTTEDVNNFLLQQSAKVTAWLVQYGYAIPIVLPTAKPILDNFVNLGAAGLAELTQRSAGYDPDSDDARERTFLAEFERVEEFIKSGTLAAMGVPQVVAGALAAAQPAIGVIKAGTTNDTSRSGFPPEWRR